MFKVNFHPLVKVLVLLCNILIIIFINPYLLLILSIIEYIIILNKLKKNYTYQNLLLIIIILTIISIYIINFNFFIKIFLLVIFILKIKIFISKFDIEYVYEKILYKIRKRKLFKLYLLIINNNYIMHNKKVAYVKSFSNINRLIFKNNLRIIKDNLEEIEKTYYLRYFHYNKSLNYKSNLKISKYDYIVSSISIIVLLTSIIWR